MRIAVAYFGIPRCSSVCYPSIERNILGPLRALGEVKEFYHLYRLEHIDNPRSGEKQTVDAAEYHPFEGLEGELEVPGPALGRWNRDAILAFGNDFRDDGAGSTRTIENLIHQLASLHRVTMRLADWSPDVVAFVRPDLLYHDPWNPEVAARCAQEPRRIYVPEWQNWGGLNDRFALAGAQAAQAYGRRAESVLEFCTSRRRPLHPERLVDWALEHAKAQVHFVGWRASRVRSNGEVRTEPFYRDRHSVLLRALLPLVRRVRDPLRNLSGRYRAE